MPKLQLQFHAEPAELLELTAAWARTGGYGHVAEQFFPEYEVVGRTVDGPSLDGREMSNLHRIALTAEAPVLDADSEQEFAVDNPDALYVLVGALNADGLRQSALGAITEDRALLRRWRETVKLAKAEMHAGATVRNPNTGHAAHSRRHLHTPGAHRLADRGVAMLAIAGWNVFVFDDLQRS
jgi:hypothetical protein